MPDLDLHTIAERYHRALDAKPGKGPMTDKGIAAITDSVADVPDLLAEVERLRDLAGERRRALETAETTIRRVRSLVSDWQANGNSRALGDPRADVWQECAGQLLDALNHTGAEADTTECGSDG